MAVLCVLCGMTAIQYSARSAQLSVRLSNCRIMFSLNQMICTSLDLYLQVATWKRCRTPYRYAVLASTGKAPFTRYNLLSKRFDNRV